MKRVVQNPGVRHLIVPSRLGPPRAKPVWIVWLLGGVVVGAAVGVVPLAADHSSKSAALPPPVGVTFQTAEQLSDAVLANMGGGPWHLFSVLGVVAVRPVWLDPIGDAPCRGYPGVSIWNASSMPLSSPGQYDTGVAPFWSLLYLDAASDIEDAVTLANQSHLVGPILPDTAWGQQLHRMINSTVSLSVQSSSDAARRAWNLSGDTFAANHPQPVEFYETGGGQLYQWGSQSDEWTVGFQLCGPAGYTNESLPVAVSTLLDSGRWIAVNGTSGCGAEYGYVVSMGAGPLTPVASTSVEAELELSVNFTVGGPAFGLVSWMAQPGLTNGTSAVMVPSATLECSSLDWSAATCHATDGWYAALVGPTGGWLDVYATVGGRAGWFLGNVPIYTGDSLAVVLSSNYSSGPFSLSVSSTTTSASVTGSAVID